MTSQSADQLLGLGRWADARAAYEEYLNQHPDDVDGRAGHGIAVLGTGDATAAVLELNWVLERAPGRADARYNRAMAYATLGHDTGALADLDLLVASQPHAWYLRSDRGGLLLRGGQVEEALVELRQAVELAPEEPGPWLNLGSALLAAGQPVEAHEYLSRATKAGVPGAYTALRRARQEYYDQADWDEVRETAASVLAARSAAEVAEFARAAPYLLAESLLHRLEQALRSRQDLASTEARLRLADLRRLAAGEEGSSRAGTAEQDSYRRLADQQVLLYQRGDREEAVQMAPALVEMARSVFGPDSAEYGLQLASQATLERSDALFGEALGVLTRVAPGLVPGVAANHASTQSDQAAAALLASVLPYVDMDIPQETAARVYESLGDRLRRQGRMQEAELVGRGALGSRRFTGAARARLLVSLAQTLFCQQGNDEAADLCEQALDQYREALGDTHEKIAETQRGLGRIHAEAGHTEQAERWLVRAADTWRRLGDPVQLALTQGDLAAFYARAGAQAVARRVAAEALDALGSRPGGPHEATVLFAIRDAFHQLGDLTDELSVQLRLVELVPEPIELNNLADIYYRCSRHEDAARWYTEALGQAPPGDAFVIHHNLANALYELGRTDEGIAHHEQALAGMRAALPAGDATLLHTLVDLAGTLACLGQLDRAAALIAEAQPYLGGVPVLQAKAVNLAQQLNLDPTRLGSAEEQYQLLVQQARQARARGAYPEAERILAAAIELVAQAYGPRHSEIAGLKLFLAAVRREGGGVRGAEELIREALSIQEESLAPDDRMLVVSRTELGTLLAEARRDDEAAELLASAAEQSEGEQLGRVLTALGLIAQRRGDLAAAEGHLRRALDLAEEPDNLLVGRKNLVMLLIEQRRLGEARELAEQTVTSGSGPRIRGSVWPC